MKRPVLLISLLLIFSANLYAGISVYPARSEVSIDANGVYEGKYTVTNNNADTIILSVTYENWRNSPENAGVKVEDWLSVANEKLILEPNQKADIVYKISSKDYRGSLSAMVSFTYSAPNMTGINLMTSVPIYMTIKGTEKVDFEITELSLSNPKMYKEEGFPAVFKVKNNGNLPVRLKGSLTVKKGKKIILEKSIGEQSPVYAGSERIFTEKFQPPQKGKYVLNISLNAFDISAEKSIQFRVNKFGDISF